MSSPRFIESRAPGTPAVALAGRRRVKTSTVTALPAQCSGEPPHHAPPARRLEAGAAQHQLDVLRLGLARSLLDLVHDLNRGCRNRRRHAFLATLSDHVTVHIVDLG